MSAKRGAVAESLACTKLLANGFDVCFPARGLNPHYDLVLVEYMEGRPYRLYTVQVKRAHMRVRNGKEYMRCNLVDSTGATYNTDFISVVDVDSDRVWLIPSHKLGDQVTIQVSGGRYDEWLI